MAIETIVSANDEPAFNAFLQAQIRTFNNQRSSHHLASRQPSAISPLNLILKDASGQIVGGLAASTYWAWLDIDHFYVPETLRGSGIGTSLLQTAETIAIQRGCKHSFLSTFEFQARTFYEQRGYSVVGTLTDYPPSSVFYWMRKDLTL